MCLKEHRNENTNTHLTKNLFFREYYGYWKLLSVDRFMIRNIIFFFLLSSHFFKATALEAKLSPQDPQTSIYVSGNVLVYDSTDHPLVITLDKKPTSPTNTAKKKTVKSSSHIELTHHKKRERFKKLAEKIDSVKKQAFYSSSPESHLINSFSFNRGKSVISSNLNTMFKSSGSKNVDFKLVVKYNTQLQQQKFYTSLSYLQFEKYRSSSLRGPPTF